MLYYVLSAPHCMCWGVNTFPVCLLPQLENRSFDHMVGMLKGNNSAIDGCAMNDANPKCANPVNPLDPESEVVAVDNEAVYVQPADPSHSVGGTAEQ